MKKDGLYSDDVVQWYDELYYTKEQTKKEVDFYTKLFQKNNSKNILEVSAGAGRLTIPIAKKGFQISGLDISKDMIDLARINSKKENLNIDFYVQSMENFELKEKFFDCIIIPASVVGYMVDNDFAINTFNSCYKHLKNGGFLIFDVNNFWNKLVEKKFNSIIDNKANDEMKMSIEVNPIISNINNTVVMSQNINREYRGKKLKPFKREFNLRVYTLNDFDLLFRLTKFKLIESYSDFNLKKKLTEKKFKRFIIVSQKQ